MIDCAELEPASERGDILSERGGLDVLIASLQDRNTWLRRAHTLGEPVLGELAALRRAFLLLLAVSGQTAQEGSEAVLLVDCQIEQLAQLWICLDPFVPDVIQRPG